MNELLKITTDEQGSSVVSARELHGFLEVKSKFADWIKNRIIKYGFREDTDYVSLSKNLENGGREYDYALTLDTAKQLTMVENNDRGKQARRYFIDAEKALRQVVATPPAALSTEQILIQLVSQQNQMMADTQLLLAQLRADVDEIKAGQKPISRRQLPGPPKGSKLPLSSLRQKVTRGVNDYCALHGVEQSEAYNYLYKRMYELNRINVHQMHRKPGEYIIDAIERYGYLNYLYGLVMSELHYTEE